MIAHSNQFNRRLVLLILLSFVILSAAIVLRVGIGQTPYETTDSAGRAMGFNDRLGAEHYRIMVRNFKLTGLFQLEYAYEWLLLAMHGIGAGLLLSSRASIRTTRWFFFVQPLLFPFGILALPLWPSLIPSLLPGTMVDREGFIDIPYIAFVAQPTWLLTSVCIVLALRGPGLGITHIGWALAERVCGGIRRLPKAFR